MLASLRKEEAEHLKEREGRRLEQLDRHQSPQRRQELANKKPAELKRTSEAEAKDERTVRAKMGSENELEVCVLEARQPQPKGRSTGS